MGLRRQIMELLAQADGAPVLPEPAKLLADGGCNVLCVDLSLTMTGWALVRLPLTQEDRSGILIDPVLDCGDIPLKDAKRPLRERINELCDTLAHVTDPWERASGASTDLVALEVPQHTYAGTRNTMVAGPHGLEMIQTPKKGQQAIIVQQRAFGAVVQWLTFLRGLPVIEVDPQDSKRALTGAPTAGKTLVDARLRQLFTGFTDGALPARWSEGVRDALAVAYYLDGELSRLRQGAPSVLARPEEQHAPTIRHPRARRRR